VIAAALLALALQAAAAGERSSPAP